MHTERDVSQTNLHLGASAPINFGTLLPESFSRVCREIAEKSPQRLNDAFIAYLNETDVRRKEALYKALLNTWSNRRSSVNRVDLALISERGFKKILSVLNCPLGRRQGFGLLTDFHLMSLVFLKRLGEINFLPLPARMPRSKPVPLSGTCDGGDSRVALAKLIGLNEEDQAGRTYRYNSTHCNGTETLRLAMKAERQGLSVDPLAYEAAVMNYLVRYREYFGLCSELPVASKGVRNRTHAWEIQGQNHLIYAAPPSYFVYLEEIAEFDRFSQALKVCVGDLMRLARFGIFHTALAPIFHNHAQERPYIWNIGGLLPGAGTLSAWQEAFQYGNSRQSGISDFEHFVRFRKLLVAPDLVNDTETQEALGLQYHLGNVIFCALHWVGLWSRRNGGFEGICEPLIDLTRDLLMHAHLSFSGKSWDTFDLDVDCHAIVHEMAKFMGAEPGSPHYFSDDGIRAFLGPYSGAYPIQELIKGITAFTIRAIHAFGENRSELRRSLPLPNPIKPPSVGNLVRDKTQKINRGDFYLPFKELQVFKALIDAGMEREKVNRVVDNLRGRDIRTVSVETDEPRLTINGKGLLCALRDALGKERALKLGNSVKVEIQERGPFSLREAVRELDVWFF